ncbi:MAG: ATP-binding protein [Candidatus Symbiothrix sp.]|jgi:predicted AAA+ superfamily ATPase|nr:ATP-binding protein [Candidatus Symbiothrix sp.]
MEQMIINQNPHWAGKKYTNLQARTVFESLKTNLQTKHIQILTGIRRSGKSSLFAMLINELMQDNEPKSILKLNMDNPLFFEIWDNPALFYNIIATTEKITDKKVKYLFLDEVQVVKAWETFVKSVYDTGNFNKIFVTGSNSFFLQNEYSTFLSGRYLDNVVYPYSFSEILQQNEIRSYFDLVSNTTKALQLLDKCLEWGCFPEIISTKNKEIKTNLLSSYFDSIIMKDCVSRYQIADIAVFKKLLLYAISNAGSVFSYKSLARAVGTNENTAKKYINILNDSYIIQDISNFAFSLKDNVRNSHKLYVADNGIMNAVSYRFWDNKAKLFENFVFNELQKQQPEEITFANNSGECDFVVKKDFDYQAIQVCFELTPENSKREFGGFANIEKEVKLSRKTIITYNQELQKEDVEVAPVWKYFFTTHSKS